MITFDNSTLRKFIAENCNFIIGSRIQKIQQPTRRELILYLRNNNVTKKLYININPQEYHICFMSEDNEKKRLLEIPKQPPMFCMLLRKYLENGKISKVHQPEYERIIEFYIETYNELAEKIDLCLAVELMGKHSNVVLYNYDTNIIIGCAHNVGSEKSREREMMGGLPYVYPPQGEKKWFQNCYFIEKEGDINSIIDDYYADLIAEYKFKNLKEKYSAVVLGRLNRVKNSFAKIEKQAVPYEKIKKYRLFGDLIMANMYGQQDFSSAITVFDYENDKTVSIDLDEKMTLKENANRFYKLYNKAKKANEKNAELFKNLREEGYYLDQLLYSIERAENISELKEISQEVESQKELAKDKRTSIQPEVILDKNYTIFIGKNNKQNDYIVSKLAKDNDLWFHTHHCAGSHVLLRTENVTDNLILKCAKLAKDNSKGSNSSKVGVIYTFAKYLKKPPKANLGYVTYSNEKEIIID